MKFVSLHGETELEIPIGMMNIVRYGKYNGIFKVRRHANFDESKPGKVSLTQKEFMQRFPGMNIMPVFGVLSVPDTIPYQSDIRFTKETKGFIEKNNGKCVPFVAPSDVKLSEQDDKTVVQPDIFVVCDRDIAKKSFFGSAPDLVIEILSPSTKNLDFGDKMRKYKETGVREYWIVDPIQKRVVVHYFESKDIPKTYGFDAKVPVGIFGDGCVIDFAEIYNQIEFMYE